MLEAILIAGIILFAVLYLTRYIYNVLQGKAACHCGAQKSTCPISKSCSLVSKEQDARRRADAIADFVAEPQNSQNWM